MYYMTQLYLTNSFQFRRLAFDEIKKYRESKFTGLSLKMIKQLDRKGFGHFLQPGIRAQLLDRQKLELVQDFVFEGDHHSMHVLNAVSPSFTCSLPFAKYIVDQIKRNALNQICHKKLIVIISRLYIAWNYEVWFHQTRLRSQ